MYRFCNPAYEACYNEVCTANLAAKRKIDHKIVFGTLEMLFYHCRKNINDYTFETWNFPAFDRYERLVHDLANARMCQLTDARDAVIERLKAAIIKEDRAYREH